MEHNLPILAALDRFNAAGYPVLIGASRKRFVGSLLAGAGVTEPDMASKDNATAAISALCAEHGVWAVRVHDVAKKPRCGGHRQCVACFRQRLIRGARIRRAFLTA